MNKSSKCKNCQWYGKPYWSIINPCDNCPNENDYKTIITIYGEPVFKETLTEESIKKAMANKSIFEITIEEKAKEIEQLQQELQRKDNIINELEKWLNNQLEKNTKWYDTELSSHDKRYYEKDFIISQSVLRETLHKLNELKEKQQ